MFRNYLKTAVRNLLRYKGFSVINILSLAIGITGCLVIALFVYDEKQYDKSIPGGDQVYRLYDESTHDGNKINRAVVAPAYATYLEQQYPEVDTAVRILMSGDRFLMERGETSSYEDKGWFAEASFFKVFPLKFQSGDPATALAAPYTMVLTEDLAHRYFGNENPVGKTVYVDKDTFEVKGVLAKLPEHCHFDFRYLMSLPSAGIPNDRMERWTWNQFYTYIRLKPGADAQGVENKFQAYIKNELYATLQADERNFLPHLQPLQDIHLKSADFVYDNAIRGNESYVKGLSIIALFVLVIACFNFINLATARSFRRAKEIGVRKVVGAERQQLIVQFIGETVLLSVLSMILAIAATMLLLPAMNAFTGKHISFNPVTHPLLALLVLGAGVLIGILAGMYPALVLSGFRPIHVLKNMKLTGSHVGWLRQSLVVVQFAFSALLIVSSIVVYRQVRYLNNKDLGFNKEQVLSFQIRGDLSKNLETFKQELRQSPGVVSVTSGYGLPGDQFAGDDITVPGKEGDKHYPANHFIGDYDYIKTLGLNLVAGRDFSRDMKTDEREAFIINETAVKELGFGSPEAAIGKTLKWNEWIPKDSLHPQKIGKVIGVVQDFHYKSLHEKVATSVIQLYPAISYKVAVKLSTANVGQTIDFIKNEWRKFVPGYPLDYKFMDETYGAMYEAEEKLGSLVWIFTVMAIVVGCLGLFALAAFNAEQRTKEIGIRKVLGADTFNIFALLSKNFLGLVLLSSVLAFPVAWWAMNKWLQDFSYRITIGWWMFAVAGAAALVIALITVSFQTVKAALANPVKNLRTE